VKKLNYFFWIGIFIFFLIIEANPFSYKFYVNGFKKLTNLFFQEKNTSLSEEYRKEIWEENQKVKSCVRLERQMDLTERKRGTYYGIKFQKNNFSLYQFNRTGGELYDENPTSSCRKIVTYRFNKLYSKKLSNHYYLGSGLLQVEFFANCSSENCDLPIYGYVKYPKLKEIGQSYGRLEKIEFFGTSVYGALSVLPSVSSWNDYQPMFNQFF
tara:strand:- start:79 stop:714 length:636 start_codon:yes stop_codon:yes gene_type:complete